MKKVIFFLTILLFTLNRYAPVLAAGVPARTLHGIEACKSGIHAWIPLVITISVIISTILLGVLVFFMFLLLFGPRFNIYGSCIRKFHKKPRKPKIPNFEKELSHNKKMHPDHYNNNKNCNKSENKNPNKDHPNGCCDKKYDPGIGYSLDCDHIKSFPYYNNYKSFY